MWPLIDGVGATLRDEHPRIYEMAFEATGDSNMVNLCDLDAESFGTVYDLTKDEFRKYCEAHGGADQAAELPAFKNWIEYLGMLETDPRLELH